jgi:hypothetical protein
MNFKIKFSIAFFILLGMNAFPQNKVTKAEESLVSDFLDSLWVNPTSFFNKNDTNWRVLCSNLKHVDKEQLNQITASIFTGSRAIIENESTASEGLIGYLNKKSQVKKDNIFEKKIERNFANKEMYPYNKIVLVEGDSWFEFPLFLHEVTDNLIKQDNLAIYSLASGGDWVSNMISSGDYQNEYRSLKPDVFIISGGGNDMVGEHRLSKMIADEPIAKDSPFLNDYKEYVVLRQNNKAVPMCNANFCPIEYHFFSDSLSLYTSNIDAENLEKIVNGRRYIHKNFYRWLVTFKLEYKILFESIRKIDPAHFDSLKIITQGYDYAIPNSRKKIGVRMLMRNGKWLQKPLENRGIFDQYTQESIIMALMFDFNEMLIELGKEYPNIYHVDVRGFTRFLEVNNNKRKGKYWYDELHPSNPVFAEIAKTYIAIINNTLPKNNRVISVIQYYNDKNH